MPVALPHGPCLHSNYELAPKSPIPLHFRPLDGVEYKVSSGDTFASLAAFASMNVWDLIRFNYQTSNPKEVNWYLHHRTGCKSPDWDMKNFKFDDLDDPGVIYFPKTAYDRLLDAGLKPKKFYSEEDFYRVPGRIRNFAQVFRTVTCWAIGTSMMMSWKDPYLDNVEEALKTVGEKWWKRFDKNQALDDFDMTTFTAAAGLKRGGVLETPEMWMWAIRTLGPLMLRRPSAEGFVHWVVVTGYHVEPPYSFKVRFTESSNGASRELDWEILTNGMKRDAGVLPAMYHWG
jgi:hypothetical protein